MFRVGIGYDVHKLVEGRNLILGGVNIPFELGLEGHSDADVLYHAICDALLGSLALGDIGKHFPDTDGKYENANSAELLRGVYDLVEEEGWKIVNVDCVLCVEKPKLAPYILDMRINIANVLNTELGNVSVKATTEEQLGFTGRMEGISSQCICMIEKR